MRKRVTPLDCQMITATNIGGVTLQLQMTGIPDTCPMCHRSVCPRQVTAAFSSNPDPGRERLQVVFQCPSSPCEQLFIGTYKPRQLPPSEGGGSLFELKDTAPWSPRTEQFSAHVRRLSPRFEGLCNQALVARQAGLTDIAGMGFRKALEFLVKDFAINQQPDRADEIRGMWLADCIRTRIADPNIQSCAERAAWLGNDECHYTRQYANRDIVDLQRLLGQTMRWVENVLVTQEYQRELQRQRQPRRRPARS